MQLTPRRWPSVATMAALQSEEGGPGVFSTVASLKIMRAEFFVGPGLNGRSKSCHLLCPGSLMLFTHLSDPKHLAQRRVW